MRVKALLCIVAILIVGSLVSCSSPSYLLEGYNNVPPITVTVTPTPMISSGGTPLPVAKVININDQTFVYPAKVCISSIDVGKSKDFKIQVHNGNSEDTEFDVYVQIPGVLSNEQKPTKETPLLSGIYEPASNMVNTWLTFDKNIMVQAKWTENINIKLTIPEGVVLPKKWYFYIVTKDLSQGNVGGANGATIFVNMY